MSIQALLPKSMVPLVASGRVAYAHGLFFASTVLEAAARGWGGACDVPTHRSALKRTAAPPACGESWPAEKAHRPACRVFPSAFPGRTIWCPGSRELFVKRTIVSIASIVMAASAAGGVQEKPDLSGIWVAVKDAPANLPLAPSAILGARFGIRHKGNSFTMVRPRGAFSIEATYEIGGPEVRMRSPGTGCLGDAYFIDVAAWEGNAVAFTATGTHPAGAAQPTKLNIKRFLRLEAPDSLVVEATITQDGQPRQVGTLYKRSTETLPPLAAALPATKAAAAIADVAWVGGTWVSEPATAGGTATEERWTPPAGGAMIGISRTMRGPSMTAYEFLCIVERDGSLVYNAMPNGRAPATEFVLTHLKEDSATFENPSHDYPKVIKYSRRADGSLETAISGAANQRVVTVVLKRQ